MTDKLASAVLSLGPFETNTYLITCPTTGETAVVDVGFEPERVIALVRERALPVRYLLNTHAHYDHVAGMKTVQDALGGTYWLHPGDRPLLDRLAQQASMFGLPGAEPPTDVHELSDGLRIRLGGHVLEVIHTPGHSPGGVCFWSGQELWVGDTLFAGSIGRTDLPGGDFAQLEQSIHKRLFPLGDGILVYPGHGATTTIGRERVDNPFVGARARIV